ncbi:ABC transporter substrate-binding protein [Pseudoroseicyclus aestuarii]|uniref:ABC-type nitrate/sulfonate/bicarbonate transport system substrate-binding protein n=1 Tax=Pseudoroseicyclus aestuarii TaxID=1795041 RepID=A0A318SVA1_9RHOB|nr:ABC transporter substrate-binding protein [Pseudoroseicyclus aestuarii]PYE85345.1 ABC-type nitrate/sulfonate/bicarbonate transport system substrate-binding protein [Pseudoroseicyclus aestuarii]
MRSTLTTLLALAAAPLAAPALAQETEITFTLPHANIAVGEEVFLVAVPQAMGWFEEEGLDVTVTTIGGSAPAGQLLVAGQADISAMLAEAVLAVREQGGDTRAFWSLKENNGFMVGVPPGSEIGAVSDLSGKTVGFAAVGSGSDMMVREQLRLDGADPTYSGVSVGMGPGVRTAVENGQVDALVLWDAIYGMMENQGLELEYYDIPLQDEIAGYALVSTDEFMAENPEAVEGFCRAGAKGLAFTLAEPELAIGMFFDAYPSAQPAGVSREEAVADGVNILTMWLDRAMKGADPESAELGRESPERWAYTAELYQQFGQLTGAAAPEDGYTNDFIAACNDFDRAAVIEQAQAMAVEQG